MIKHSEKLPALTSLRFIAAAMIACAHSLVTFLASFSFIAKHSHHIEASLFQGVSFFFVLSGFILAYVYPKLLRQDIKKFLWARFARIWPAHILAMFLFLLLVGNKTSPPIYEWMLNILMLHAWFPNIVINFSFNGVSWSISTEFFFYFCFPMLIYKLRSSWSYKLLMTLIMLIAMILLCHILHFAYLLCHSLVYINPLSRLFEFMLGMSLVFVFYIMKDKNISFFYGSCIEIVAITLLLFSICITPWLSNKFEPDLGLAAADWIKYSGSCLAIGLMIVVMACQKGFISKMLSLRFFVVSGEISYAFYLIHLTIFLFIYTHMKWFSSINIFVLYGLFWATCIIMAYLIWNYFERPMRSFLIRLPEKLKPKLSAIVTP